MGVAQLCVCIATVCVLKLLLQMYAVSSSVFRLFSKLNSAEISLLPVCAFAICPCYMSVLLFEYNSLSPHLFLGSLD
jgi:hypothetical protein